MQELILAKKTNLQLYFIKAAQEKVDLASAAIQVARETQKLTRAANMKKRLAKKRDKARAKKESNKVLTYTTYNTRLRRRPVPLQERHRELLNGFN